MERLTALERESLEVLYLIRSAAERKLLKSEFLDVMTHIRNVIMHLENKRYGCATGKHAGVCDCKWEK